MDYKIKINNINESVSLSKVPDDAFGFLCSKISENFNKNDKLIIARNDFEIEFIAKQISFFNPDIKILTFYNWDCLPYDRSSPKPAILANRIKTLYQLANRQENENFFIITSIKSIQQKIILANELKNLGIYLKVGDHNSLNQVIEFLINKGYKREACANNIGEFAVRGGIIDIVVEQAGDLIGYRIDFFGNEIESIKVFDPITQITTDNVKFLQILPTSEVILTTKTIDNFRYKYRSYFGNILDDQLYQAISEGRSYQGMEHWLPLFYEKELTSFFSYLVNPVIFYNQKIYDFANEFEKNIIEYEQARIDELKIRESQNLYYPIKRELLYFSAQETINNFNQFINIEFCNFDCKDNKKRILELDFKTIPDFSLAGRANKKDPIELFKEFILEHNDKKLLLACFNEGFKERLYQIFHDYNLNIDEIKQFQEIKKTNNHKINLFIMPIGFGFITSDFILVGEQAIFGEKTTKSKNSKIASQRIIEETLTLSIGELVVHRDHGIGKFDGIHTIKNGSYVIDMVKIIYDGGDVLFVPVDDINLITRYGSENSLIQLDRLGGANWKNRREKIRKRIKIAAEELIKVAAKRALRKSDIFIADNNFYDEFVSRFKYNETNDQLKAINEVEQDLKKGIPMDRLICGDVGFGKTEVAMRASAIVCCNDAQVAIISPTTILTRQHYKNFSKRFEGSDIKIVQLSRLVSNTESKLIREQIENNQAKIIIGTHSLLQDSVKFKNLGLVIIDEEQHFGVAQKEKLKKIRSEVHVLSLSATPIPRTLQMSLAGVKDLSLISTPPVDRLAVRNFVMPYDSVIVKEAIMREYNRGGKVFFVVPRVRDIEEIEPRLKTLLPELNIEHAHGQIAPSKLEEIMTRFIDGKTDLLISTTIIESGIDISIANTMIIYKAEMFGLSQLYQLRGRIGRGKLRGYCYFMLDNRKKISNESKKKLEVMQNLDSLGVGFSIATYDMDIRGSGNLLGDEQSGHIKETGVELYQQMLLETIEKIKNNNEITLDDNSLNFNNSVSIKLGISLIIPENYISDLSLRMSFYKKISNIKNFEDKENIINEMNDRFGKIPDEIFNLIEIALLKNKCRQAEIETIEISQNGILIGFFNNKFSCADKLMNLVFGSKGEIKLNNQHKILFVKNNFENTKQKIKIANESVQTILNLI